MAKPVNLSIGFRVPEGTKPSSVSIRPSGEIVITDEDGKEVTPEFMDRVIHYDRPHRPDKGPKIQGRHKLTNDLATVGGLKELTQYDSIFIIDTNTTVFEHGSVSVACFVRCRVVPEKEKFRIISDEGRLNIYEFHNVQGNPELFSEVVPLCWTV